MQSAGPFDLTLHPISPSSSPPPSFQFNRPPPPRHPLSPNPFPQIIFNRKMFSSPNILKSTNDIELNKNNNKFLLQFSNKRKEKEMDKEKDYRMRRDLSNGSLVSLRNTIDSTVQRERLKIRGENGREKEVNGRGGRIQDDRMSNTSIKESNWLKLENQRLKGIVHKLIEGQQQDSSKTSNFQQDTILNQLLQIFNQFNKIHPISISTIQIPILLSQLNSLTVNLTSQLQFLRNKYQYLNKKCELDELLKQQNIKEIEELRNTVMEINKENQKLVKTLQEKEELLRFSGASKNEVLFNIQPIPTVKHSPRKNSIEELSKLMNQLHSQNNMKEKQNEQEKQREKQKQRIESQHLQILRLDYERRIQQLQREIIKLKKQLKDHKGTTGKISSVCSMATMTTEVEEIEKQKERLTEEKRRDNYQQIRDKLWTYKQENSREQ